MIPLSVLRGLVIALQEASQRESSHALDVSHDLVDVLIDVLEDIGVEYIYLPPDLLSAIQQILSHHPEPEVASWYKETTRWLQ